MMTSEQVRELAAQLFRDQLKEWRRRNFSWGHGDLECAAFEALDEAEAFAKVDAERKESPTP